MKTERPGAIRTLIVDDEPPARDRLRRLLEDLSGVSDGAHNDGAPGRAVEIVGEAADGLEAVRLTEALAPDLLLLDIQMPELDGFGVLEALEPEAWPHVIFVTAYDEFAIRAFEVRALDYLMKPVDRDRLAAALARATEAVGAGGGRSDPRRTAMRAAIGEIARDRDPIDRFLVRGPGRLSLVRTREVDWIEAAGNYVRLHAGGTVHLLRASLGELETRLDTATFARIHRSTIVNLDAVAELRPLSHGDLTVRMRDGAELRLSRRYRDRLPATLEG